MYVPNNFTDFVYVISLVISQIKISVLSRKVLSRKELIGTRSYSWIFHVLFS